MADRRNDRELADVMRRLLKDTDASAVGYTVDGKFFIVLDEITVPVTELQMQALQEETR